MAGSLAFALPPGTGTSFSRAAVVPAQAALGPRPSAGGVGQGGGGRWGFPLSLALAAVHVRAAHGRGRAEAARRRATGREQQVLPFVDSASGREVVLIASVHFNPRSVEKAAAVTRRLARQEELAAVVLESCPSRWAKVEELQQPGSLWRLLLDNEMQAAEDEAKAVGRAVVLGDQRIEDLSTDIKAAGQEALEDLGSFPEGWFRTFAEIWDGALTLLGRKAKAKGGSDALGLWDFADPALVFGFLVAVPRYLLSTALKAPALLVAVLAFFTLYALLPANLLGDVLVFLIEAVMLRVILSVLLRDRDLILARSIRQTASSARDPGTVVAVLGAAHCNGVKRHLESASMEESESAL